LLFHTVQMFSHVRREGFFTPCVKVCSTFCWTCSLHRAPIWGMLRFLVHLGGWGAGLWFWCFTMHALQSGLLQNVLCACMVSQGSPKGSTNPPKLLLSWATLVSHRARLFHVSRLHFFHVLRVCLKPVHGPKTSRPNLTLSKLFL